MKTNPSDQISLEGNSKRSALYSVFLSRSVTNTMVKFTLTFNCLTDRPTDRPTDRLTYQPTDRPKWWLTDWVTDWLSDWLTDWLTDLLTDWLTNLFSGWGMDGGLKEQKLVLFRFIALHCISFHSFHFRNSSPHRPASQQQQFAYATLSAVWGIRFLPLAWRVCWKCWKCWYLFPLLPYKGFYFTMCIAEAKFGLLWRGLNWHKSLP